ncbi:MAG TPA: D-aminoacyl-tRNA deacylase [Candidatus Thermoplasmatota archaeon]|nr:D-aminoacyl-tRNA deacylase [Candidatus Thermoplasmatota archaeon]
MLTIVESDADVASVGICAALRALRPFRAAGRFQGSPVEAWGSLRIVRIAGLHIFAERLDEELSDAGLAPSVLAFASRHASESGRRSLTVHPIGNFGKAPYGGEPGALPPAAPSVQSFALRRLSAHARGLPYDVTFEATHHGPLVAVPAFFLEVGSHESEWNDARAHEALARTLLDLPDAPEEPAVVGVGGGHYAPRHGDLTRKRRAAVGHVLSDHALAAEPPDASLRAAFAGSGTRSFHVDARSAHAERAARRLLALGFSPVAPDAFPERGSQR